MRTRYQHGNLQLDKRKNGADVWVYRWREYGANGRMHRRGEMIGTIDQFPTKAEALKVCEHLQLTANSENPTSRTIAFGALLDRYVVEGNARAPLHELGVPILHRNSHTAEVGRMESSQPNAQRCPFHDRAVAKIA